MNSEYPKFTKQHEAKMTRTKLEKARDYFMNKIVDYINNNYKDNYGINFDNDKGKLRFSINEYVMKDNLGFTKKRIEKIGKRLKNHNINVTFYVDMNGRLKKNLDVIDCFIIPEMHNDNFIKEKVDSETDKIYGYSVRIKNEDSAIKINRKMKDFILLLENILKVTILTQSDKNYLKELEKLMNNVEG